MVACWKNRFCIRRNLDRYRLTSKYLFDLFVIISMDFFFRWLAEYKRKVSLFLSLSSWRQRPNYYFYRTSPIALSSERTFTRLTEKLWNSPDTIKLETTSRASQRCSFLLYLLCSCCRVHVTMTFIDEKKKEKIQEKKKEEKKRSSRINE